MWGGENTFPVFRHTFYKMHGITMNSQKKKSTINVRVCGHVRIRIPADLQIMNVWCTFSLQTIPYPQQYPTPSSIIQHNLPNFYSVYTCEYMDIIVTLCDCHVLTVFTLDLTFLKMMLKKACILTEVTEWEAYLRCFTLSSIPNFTVTEAYFNLTVILLKSVCWSLLVLHLQVWLCQFVSIV